MSLTMLSKHIVFLFKITVSSDNKSIFWYYKRYIRELIEEIKRTYIGKKVNTNTGFSGEIIDIFLEYNELVIRVKLSTNHLMFFTSKDITIIE